MVDDDFEESQKELVKRLEKEELTRQREFEEHERELEKDRKKMERDEKLRTREIEEFEREIERERRRERRHRHGAHPIPPIPPVPPIPPFPPIMHFDEDRFEEEEEFFKHRRRKNITIRGINSEQYDEFSAKVQSISPNLGMVFSRMLMAVISKFNGHFPTLSAEDIMPPKRLLSLIIRHKDSIIISKKDLEQSESRLSLRNIGIVTIAEDVTDELLKIHIDSIEECELVKIPKHIPKLISLSLLNRCRNYEFY